MSFCRCLCLLWFAVSLIGCNATPEDAYVDTREGAEFRTGNLVEPGYVQEMGYATRWVRSLSLEDGQKIHAVEPLGDLLVCVERPENVVTALDLSNGGLVWKLVVGDRLEELGAPTGDETNIYVSSSRRVFVINRARGEVTDIQDLEYLVSTSPLLIGKVLVFGTGRGIVLGHDVEAGYKIAAYGLPDSIEAPPVRIDDKVFVTDTAGNYVMLRTSDGELRWSGSTYGPVSTKPAADRAFIILASEDQSLYSLTATTGRQRWLPYRSEVALTESPTVIDGVIYIEEPGLGLSAIDGNNGQLLWRTQRVSQPVTLHQGELLAYTGRELLLLDPETGDTRLEQPTRRMQDVVQGPAGSLILVSPGGDLIRIDPQ
jgi:outer membrane protein assembly factor BamB